MQISTATGTEEPRPEVTIDGLGTATVLWQQWSSGGAQIIQASRSLEDGGWSAPATLATIPNPTTQLPFQLSSDPSGETLAGWLSQPHELDVARYSAGAVAWSATEHVASNAFGLVQLAAPASGIIVYEYANPGFGGDPVPWIARRNASTGVWTTAALAPNGGNFPQAVAFPNGETLVAWVGSPNQLVTAQRFDSNGARGTPLPVDSVHSAVDLTLAGNSSGQALALWFSFGPPFSFQSARGLADGGFVSAGAITAVTGAPPLYAHVAMDELGNGWVSWLEGTIPERGIGKVAFFDPPTGWRTPVEVSPASGQTESGSTFALAADGRGLVVWGGEDLHGMRLLPGGVTGSTQTLVPGGGVVVSRPSVAAAPSGFLVVWSQPATPGAPWSVLGAWCR